GKAAKRESHGISDFGDDFAAEPEGGVIDYDAEFSPAPPRPPNKPGGKSRQKANSRRGKPREEVESRPRESFGKRRGGKRVFSPQEQGHGPAGEKGGNFRFRPKRKKHYAKSYGAENQRRGGRRNQKPEQPFGK